MNKKTKTQKTIAQIIVYGVIAFFISGTIISISYMIFIGGYSKCVHDANKIILKDNLTK